jgi:hypothetical protein
VIVTVDGFTVCVLAPKLTVPRSIATFVVVTVTPYEALGVIVTVNESDVAARAVAASPSAAIAASILRLWFNTPIMLPVIFIVSSCVFV